MCSLKLNSLLNNDLICQKLLNQDVSQEQFRHCHRNNVPCDITASFKKFTFNNTFYLMRFSDELIILMKQALCLLTLVTLVYSFNSLY